jgi:hypothetical protein
MFITLLSVTFLIALVVSYIVSKVFTKPISNILSKIIADTINKAWVKYLQFSIFVVGISSGVRIWDLEKYITPSKNSDQIITLNYDRWILEIYRTIIGSLIGLSWMLLVFFMFALIAYVIVRLSENKHKNN